MEECGADALQEFEVVRAMSKIAVGKLQLSIGNRNAKDKERPFMTKNGEPTSKWVTECTIHTNSNLGKHARTAVRLCVATRNLQDLAYLVENGHLNGNNGSSKVDDVRKSVKLQLDIYHSITRLIVSPLAGNAP